MPRPTIDDYKRCFKEADTDGSGSLTISEFVKMMRKSGFRGSNSEIESYFRRTDTSNDGLISENEFLRIVGAIPEENAKEAAMRGVFMEFDANGDGTVDKCELKKIFEQMKKYFSDNELERMIAQVDQDGDGVISYEEFVDGIFKK